ncbi:hypothetical protein DPMN_001651 [Dreissena polymorpha]|uniref:Uncharacterized protein n=1 Tax=Dreissena polymorpha TaxID=45954 RepID=A0A9D4MIS5_DREPO|nr:hypothetical protein DPMN_001651 [Dreissena polymorpha]
MLLASAASSPSFTYCIFPVFFTVFFFRLSLSTMSASSWRTLSCLHLYLPCVRAVWQDDSVCSSVPIFQQSGQVGSSSFPHLFKFAGEGSRS